MTGFVLAPLFGSDIDADVMRFAVAVGRRRQCHVHALHTRYDPRNLVGITAPGMSASMYEQMVGQAKHDAQEQLARARDVFERETLGITRSTQPSTGFSVGWTEVEGEDPVVIAEHARLANLVVLGRPDGRNDVHAALAVEAVLFDAARPVVVVPPDAPNDWGRRVFVAWNGSAPAARAMYEALPFIGTAEQVIVGSVADGVVPDADAAAEALQWQGVAATPLAIDSSADDVGRHLFAAAAEKGCDLVVMGAYGHSRLREFILGGVTRYALYEATAPLFMSH